MKPFDFQTRIIQQTYEAIEEGRRKPCIVAPCGAGKCLSPDTWVWSNGLKRFSEAWGSDRIAGFSSVDRVVGWYDDGIREGLRIETQSGWGVDGTLNHQIWIRDDSGFEGWRRLADLKVGDYAAIGRGQADFGSVKIPLDEAYSLGLFVADGCISRATSERLQIDKQIPVLEAVLPVLAKWESWAGGVGVDRQLREKSDYHAVASIYAPSLREMLRERYGYDHEYSKDRSIPKCILEGTKDVICAFLRGYFDGDGYCDKVVAVSSASRVLAEQVGQLLLGLGIFCGIRTKKTKKLDAHIVEILDRSQFDSVVGMTRYGLIKDRNLDALMSKKINTNIDIVPGVGRLIYSASFRFPRGGKGVFSTRSKAWENASNYYDSPGRVRKVHRPSFDRLAQLTSDLPECPEKIELSRIISEGRAWSRIEKIAPSVIHRIDCEVEDSHAFIGNGLVNHNTFISSQILQDYTINFPNPSRGCFLVDRTVLLDQTAKELKHFGVRSTILQGSRKIDHYADVTVASIQSITPKLQSGKTPGDVLGELGILIFDECHISAFSKTARAIISYYDALGVPVVGLTGSPWRLSKKQWLGQVFDCAITAPQPPELVKIGRIVPARCFTLGGVIDVSQLDVGRDGEFVESQMEDQAIGRIALETVVAEYKRLGENRLAAAYCSGVRHAELLAAEFNRQGIAAEWQSAATPLGRNGAQDHREGKNTRSAQSYRLGQGITRVICSVDTLSTGWNVPACKLILMVRATQSRALFIQAANRGSRYCPESGFNDYLLLDFGENVKRFGGSPTGFQDYSIDEPPKRKKREGDLSQNRTKTCYNCSAEINSRYQVCPYCGIDFGIEENFKDGIFDDIELAEFFDDIAIDQVKFLRQAKKDAYSAGENPDLVDQKFREKFGFLAPKDWHYAAILGNRPTTGQKLSYERYLKQFNLNRYWLQHHLQLELGSKGRPEIFTEPSPYWEVLGVDRLASWDDCLQAYKQLAELSPNIERFNQALNDARVQLQRENNREEQCKAVQLQLIA